MRYKLIYLKNGMDCGTSRYDTFEDASIAQCSSYADCGPLNIVRVHEPIELPDEILF
tara:strand:- start:280 stop:450 length:171 start_codon:yes stop_codon:yes gene_type:complete